METFEELAEYLEDACAADEAALDLREFEIRVECSGPLNDLMHAVSRAASELEGQGAKSDRVAEQLLTALARFQKETALP